MAGLEKKFLPTLLKKLLGQHQIVVNNPKNIELNFYGSNHGMDSEIEPFDDEMVQTSEVPPMNGMVPPVDPALPTINQPLNPPPVSEPEEDIDSNSIPYAEEDPDVYQQPDETAQDGFDENPVENNFGTQIQNDEDPDILQQNGAEENIGGEVDGEEEFPQAQEVEDEDIYTPPSTTSPAPPPFVNPDQPVPPIPSTPSVDPATPPIEDIQNQDPNLQPVPEDIDSTQYPEQNYYDDEDPDHNDNFNQAGNSLNNVNDPDTGYLGEPEPPVDEDVPPQDGFQTNDSILASSPYYDDENIEDDQYALGQEMMPTDDSMMAPPVSDTMPQGPNANYFDDEAASGVDPGLDPASQGAIDPATGQPIPPQIDPATGQPIDPAMAGAQPGMGLGPVPVPLEQLQQMNQLKDIHNKFVELRRILDNESHESFRPLKKQLDNNTDNFKMFINNMDSFDSAAMMPDMIVKLKRWLFAFAVELQNTKNSSDGTKAAEDKVSLKKLKYDQEKPKKDLNAVETRYGN